MLGRYHNLFERSDGLTPERQQFPLVDDCEKKELPFTHPLTLGERKVRLRSQRFWSLFRYLILGLACAVALSYGRDIISYANLTPDPLPEFRICHEDCNQFTAQKVPKFIGQPKLGILYNGTRKATCSNSETGHDCSLTSDNDTITYWRTEDNAVWPQLPGSPPGHWAAIDFGQELNLHGLAMTPQSDAADGGAVTKHVVQVSIDGTRWDDVAYGTWFANPAVKYANFEPRLARHVRLIALATTGNTKYIAVAELSIFVVSSIPTPVPDGGSWGLTLDFPIVPVTAFVNPVSGDVITLAAEKYDSFDVPLRDETRFFTLTSTWLRGKRTITDAKKENPGHTMFCPGTSFNESGHMLISGGSSSSRTSIYDSQKDKWSRGADLNVGHGYQGQTFVASGKTFLIGGGWGTTDDQNNGKRDGELYDPTKDKWDNRSGHWPAKEIEMERTKIQDSPDYHVWLFAWKNHTIFHAGPAAKMHWIPTEGSRSISAAGTRQADGVTDIDAVCGVTSMYDAERGLVLTVGGAPQYHYKWKDGDTDKPAEGTQPASNNAFILQLGEAFQNAKVIKTDQMKHKRVFANAVTLPTGETLVVGGQEEGEGFYEFKWHSEPEIFSPTAREGSKWKTVASHSTPRVYHSIALLLPDATVLVGGSGLGRAETNRFDAQIYYPPYLFKGGKEAPRPKITEGGQMTVKVGQTIKFTTDRALDKGNSVSLIRYGGVTHSLNNDQRRIELQPMSDTTTPGFNYVVKIPDDKGVALPGYWMLFAMTDGVPSVSKTIQILS